MNTNVAPSVGEFATTYTASWPQRERSGVWLTDENGKKLLSCFCAGGTFNFGFDAAEIRAQAISLIRNHDAGMWPLPSERRNKGERDFSTILPAPLDRTFFVTCAGEAFEAACKFAKRITRRRNLVSAINGYHGHIGFSLAMDDASMLPETYAPLAGGVSKAQYGSIESLSELVNEDTAAVCLETIQIPGGVAIPPDDYFGEVRRLCDERGVLLILDEVQGGLCRTGHVWAFDRYGIVPDLLVTGKGITGGIYPCGALSYANKHSETFVSPKLVHISSHAGNEIGASLAGWLAGKYAEPALCAHVNDVGGRMADGLRRLTRLYSDLLNPTLRGRGLIYAVDVTDPAKRERIVSACMAQGLFVRGTSLNPHAVNFQPPLIIGAAEVDEALNRFDRALVASRRFFFQR